MPETVPVTVDNYLIGNYLRKEWIEKRRDQVHTGNCKFDLWRDLRELLMVPLGSQEYCGVGRGPSGLHWVWCNGRGPHLELRREPQGYSPGVTWVSGCVCRYKQGVRSRHVWKHGTLLYSRVVKGVSGVKPSWIWDQGGLFGLATMASEHTSCCELILGWHLNQCKKIRPDLKWMGK